MVVQECVNDDRLYIFNTENADRPQHFNK